MVGLVRITRRAIGTAGRFCLIAALAAFFTVIATSNPAQADFTKAVYHGKAFCPKGSHFSVRKGGQCWSCPTGTKRTLLPITGKKACKRGSKKFYKKAVLVKKEKAACKKAGLKWKKKKCWSCAGYKRSLSGITSAKACVRKQKSTHYKAKYVQDFGCGIGLYMSIKKAGQCFKCPASHKFRTINKLTGAKACTSSFGKVFAADTSGFCRKVVGAISAGNDGVAKIRKQVTKVTAPVTKPIAKLLKKAAPDLKSPKAITDMLRKLNIAKPRYQPVLEELGRVAALNQSPANFSKVVLNPELVCSGDSKRVNKALLAAGLRKDFKFKKAGLFDGMLISPAHAYNANAKTVLHVISASGSVKAKGAPFAFAPSVAIVTDFGPRFHVYLSFGGALTTSPSSGAAFGYMIFPSAAIKNFKGINILGLELEVGAQQLLDVISRNKSSLARLECIKDRADGLGNQRKKCGWDGDITANISFSPKTFTRPADNVPGFGLTWNPHYDSGALKAGKGLRETSFSADYSIKLFGK